MTKIEILIKKIKIVEFKYAKIEEIEKAQNRFNIFYILRDENDEVNLHSKFIYELLNPLASHGMEDLFLKLFLNLANLKSSPDDKFKVYREKYNIDILLLSKNRAIIIENKIYSQEHSNQLERYFNLIRDKGYKEENIEIIYLTLFGDVPKDLPNKTKALSYRKDIIDWIDGSIGFVAKYPPLRESLIQYLELIKKLTYKKDNRGFVMEIKELLLEDDNLKTLLNIRSALIEAKIEIQLRFWKTLLNYLETRGYIFKFYDINRSHSLNRSVHKYYTKKKNNKDYGIEYKIAQNLNFFVEIRKNIYYGFYFDGEIDRKKLEKLDSIKIDWEKPYWKYPEKRLDFENFNENVLELVKREKLEKTIKNIGGEIIYSIENFELLNSKEMILSESSSPPSA